MSLETSSISVDDYFWSFENDELSHFIAIGSCQLFFLPSLMGGIFFITLEAEYRRPLEDIVQWEE